MNVVDNINVDKLEEFRSFLKDNPDKGRLSLEAKAVYEGQAGRSTVHIGPYALDDTHIDRPTRHYTIPFGAWREVEDLMGVNGPTDRMEPVEMALAATAACVVNAISYNAVRMGIPIEGLEVKVRSKVDPRVLFALKGPEDHGSCLGQVEYDVDVQGDISDEQLKTIEQLCIHSPVYGLLAESIPMKANVRRAEREVSPA